MIRSSTSVLDLTVTLLLLALLLATPLPAQQMPDVMIRGGWLFDGTGEQVVPNRGILVRAGKLFGIGSVPEDAGVAGARIVELTDEEYILPGLFDLHAHYAVDLLGTGGRGHSVSRAISRQRSDLSVSCRGGEPGGDA